MTLRQEDTREIKYEVAKLWREVWGSDRGMCAATVCVGVGWKGDSGETGREWKYEVKKLGAGELEGGKAGTVRGE